MEKLQNWVNQIKTKKRLRKFGFDVSKKEYDFAVRKFQEVLEDDNFLANDKKQLLQFFLKIIKKDLQVEQLASYFYYPRDKIGGYRNLFLPLNYKNNEGKLCSLELLGEKEVDLVNDVVLVCPWNHRRLLHQIKRTEDFAFDKLNHFATFYEGFNFCVVYNGLRSITDCVMNRQSGKIKATVVNASVLFNYIYTDGATWYNTVDGSVALEVIDFRVAILYTLINLINQLDEISD